MEEEEQYYQLELPIQAVRIIHTQVSKQACEKWSGGDPVGARRSYLAMRDHFYRIMLRT